MSAKDDEDALRAEVAEAKADKAETQQDYNEAKATYPMGTAEYVTVVVPLANAHTEATKR
jgi:hypothetical protein